MLRTVIAAAGFMMLGCASFRSRCDERAPARARVVRVAAMDSTRANLSAAEVVVSDLCSGRRIQFADIALIRERVAPQGIATDSFGRGTLSGPPGTSRVRERAVGFESHYFDVELRAGYSDSVYVSLRRNRLRLEGIRVGAMKSRDTQ